jgi:hypothetical protein
MTVRYTAIGELIPALVSTLSDALDIPVFDTSPTAVPSDASYVVIGGTEVDPTAVDSEVAQMAQEWHGLGAKGKLEDIMIQNVAVGRAATAADARDAALAIAESVAAAIPQKPSPHTYNATFEQIVRMERGPVQQSGFTIHAIFTIVSKARLVPSED